MEKRANDRPFDIEAYTAAGIEAVIKDILKTSLFCPEETMFMAQYALSGKRAAERREANSRNGVHVPAFLIASITSACNLHCAGCYARSLSTCTDDSPTEQLSGDEWGRIFREARDMGVGFIMLAGGEPLVRRDVLEQAAQVPQILFPVFTNGTMIDAGYLKLFDRHRNLVPIISLEGGRDETDRRRGAGVYDRLEEAVARMNRRRIAIGASITVTRSNVDLVTDRAFIADMASRGFRVFIYVEYVPTSKATEALAPDDEVREFFDSRLKELRESYDDRLFIAFPGDEKASEGCLAAGRGFFHINSHGGAEPCPFSPFSDVNLRSSSLIDALNSPLFTALRTSGMLTEDHAGGCVLYEKRSQVEALLMGAR